MDPITLSHWLAIIPGLVGILALLKPVRKNFIKLWGKTLGKRGLQLDRIEAELTPNDGTSIKDSINRIEQKQKELEAFTKASLNIHKVATVRTSADGKLTSINRQYQRLLGYSFIEVEGDGWINAIHPDDRSRVITGWKHAVESGREYHDDIKYITSDGESLMCHANVFRELDSDGNITGYLGVIVPLDGNNECPHLPMCRGLAAANGFEIT